MSLNSLLVHTFDVQKVTISVGTMGGKTETYATQTAGLRGRIEELSATQQERLYEQLHIESTHRCFFNNDPGITKKNMSQFRLIGITPVQLANRLFEIKGVKNEQELNRLWELLLFESEFLANQ